MLTIGIECVDCFVIADIVCTDDEYRCPDGWCIPLSFRCAGNGDCLDFADEQNCSSKHCIHVCRKYGLFCQELT